MGLARREELDFAAMTPERQANIEIVSSAYASMPGHKAYLTMPVTSGRRYYEVLDHHGVKTVAELEARKPGALREDVILPNIAEANELAERIVGRTALPLVVPGVFEARRQRWTQEEYMCLWMRLIVGPIREVHLSDGWEYSNGGAAEFARAILIRFRCIDERPGDMQVYDHTGDVMTLERGCSMLATSIEDLRGRDYGTDGLSRELGRLAGFAAMLLHEDRATWKAHVAEPFDGRVAMLAARRVGATMHYALA